MVNALVNADCMTKEAKKKCETIKGKCNICKKYKKSNRKLKITLPKAVINNQIVTKII